jgi:hypothetical protein
MVPRRPRPGACAIRQSPDAGLDVRAGQRTGALRVLLLRVGDDGRGARVAMLVHVLDDAGKQARGIVGAKGPRGVPVADDLAKVGHVGEHGEVPEVFLLRLHFGAVDRQVDAAEEAHVEARRRDDDVGVELGAAREDDAVGDDFGDGVGYDGGAAAVEALEVVVVGAQAEALLPGFVGWLEVRVQGEVGRELLLGFFTDKSRGALGEVDAEVVEEDGNEGVLVACGGVLVSRGVEFQVKCTLTLPSEDERLRQYALPQRRDRVVSWLW